MVSSLVSRTRTSLSLLTVLLLVGCASMPAHDPLQVTVAGIEPMQGEGMELRMIVKLRVQNPNDEPVEYNGVSVNVDVQGKTFASGVSDEVGTVPRFGESVIAVPLTVSMMRMVRQAMGFIGAGAAPKSVSYALTGKLNGASMFGTQRFSATGTLDLPTSATPTPDAT
jgi:LEA14-like dessication related protein